MKSYLKLTIILLASAIAFTGCKTKKKPTPEDTVSPGYTGDTLGWVSPPVNVAEFGEGAIGLEHRDAALESFNLIDNPTMASRDVLEPVFFEYDQAAISPAERQKVAQSYQYLVANPEKKVVVEGYCDWRGTGDYNLTLGDRRARSIMAYLVQLGLDPSRIETVSKGDLEASVDAGAEAMRKDRRADFIVVHNS